MTSLNSTVHEFSKLRPMSDDDPLPLLTPSEDFNYLDSEATDNLFSCSTLYAYVFVGITWLLCFVSFTALFSWWKYIFEPLTWNPATKGLYKYLVSTCMSFEKHVITFWCIYIGAWWWAYVRWCGWKLFRHSKGIQT
ncbi:hypothetical protein EJF18_50182 [Clavispora lusitaniae]|uniref:Uncharacterized protein n=1 Tax=Clavispora lusitaniae TaxID=36911 RepID=A0ACD0WNB7_CLALS|nr:hypothetical protein EJF14_50182 [Clavispora lusitaniae]QFZ34625.1 hypothetical protein EJF16_50182 [Clavispora lusitaniae]QFZ40310.1 hypothetical protein EJF15_50182 [Clavispora lusitaniae]QFZ45990.1 hypothetical protein EJF18_50182 [Clavispora lusitaniae]QFZ51652.1 hypothetical protein EJF17_50182 [Clavispora lusitaniae]